MSAVTMAQCISHDISTAPLTIESTCSHNYIIYGSTAINNVVVKPGYNGQITFQNLNIKLKDKNSPVAIMGVNQRPNTDPISNIDIILEGENHLEYSGVEGCAAFQVDQGTQINIRAINQSDNSSGSLIAKATTAYSGAGIGSLDHELNTNEAISTSQLVGNSKTPVTTAGGNIIISSGTITAQGGHGAGIGGGHKTYYDGMIVIYGGIVDASCVRHAAGIGSGCPCNRGVVKHRTPHSAIIVLPPAKISATGAGSINYQADPDLALSGANSIVYIGDPKKPEVTIETEDLLPQANICVDLSKDKDVANVLELTVPSDNLLVNHIIFGQTDNKGIYSFNGILQDTTSFFTDNYCKSPQNIGRPYASFDTIITQGGNITLPLIRTNISLFSFSSQALIKDYSVTEAQENAPRLKLIYSDSISMYNIKYQFGKGSLTNFEYPQFYASDSITPLPTAPTTLSKGDTLYIVTPLKTDRKSGRYEDILNIVGNWEKGSTECIKHTVSQCVSTKIEVTNCKDEPYYFDNQTITQSGIYYDTIPTPQGSDSIVMLSINFYPSYSTDDTISIRDTELPLAYEDTIFEEGTTSGTYTFYHQTKNGCDSIINLKLTIFPSYYISETITLCESELPFTYTDTVFNKGTVSGTYYFHEKTRYGCDSIVYLNLEINPIYTTTDTLTIIDTELPYHYADTTFYSGTKSGNYTATTSTKFGCDSTILLNLTVIPTFEIEIDSTLEICPEEQVININYNTIRGSFDTYSITFDTKGHNVGFNDFVGTNESIQIPIPDSIYSDIYWLDVAFKNQYFSKEYSIAITINYSSSIIVQKWDNVLALLNKNNNGNYFFTNFQWFINNEIIPNATKSYLDISSINTSGSTNDYSVKLTRTDSVVLFTCPYTLTYTPLINIYPTMISKDATITIETNSQGEVAIWNLSGKEEKRQAIREGKNDVSSSGLAVGTYLLTVINKNASRKNQMIIIKE